MFKNTFIKNNIILVGLILATSHFRKNESEIHWYIYLFISFCPIIYMILHKKRIVISKLLFKFYLLYILFLLPSVSYTTFWGLKNYIITIILGLMFLSWGYLFYENNFKRIIAIGLIVHIGVLIYQVGMFLFFDKIVNVHKILFPFSDKGYSLAYGSIPRFGGITSEPGALANAIALLLVIYLFYPRNSLILITFGLFGLYLTRSGIGIIFAFAFTISVILHYFIIPSKKSLLLIFIVIFIIVLMFPFIRSFFDIRYLSKLNASQNINVIEILDNSTKIKISVIKNLFTREFPWCLLGYGFENDLIRQEYRLPQSSGLLVYFTFYSGFFGLLFVIFIVTRIAKKIIRSKLNLIPILIVFLLTRFTPDTPFFWFMYYFIISNTMDIKVDSCSKRWSYNKTTFSSSNIHLN